MLTLHSGVQLLKSGIMYIFITDFERFFFSWSIFVFLFTKVNYFVQMHESILKFVVFKKLSFKHKPHISSHVHCNVLKKLGNLKEKKKITLCI